MRAVVRCFGVAMLVVGAASSGLAAEGYSGYPVIEIWKGQRKMELRQGDAVIREFRVVLGQQPRNSKEVQGDKRTPVGRYYISGKKPRSAFHRFLEISYPNVDDAERGYSRGLIDADQWADIFFSNVHGQSPDSGTLLGGRVGIHGYGGRPYLPIDWTEGCVAISNEDIEFLYDVTPVGTPVLIHE